MKHIIVVGVLVSVFVVVPAKAALDLAKKSGCLTCHSISAKIVGPSWKDVAAKYKGQGDARAIIIDSIANGSKGKWARITGGVSMPPYSPRVSDEDIEKIADFILGL